MGFAPIDVGVASGTVGLFATLLGTFLGGLWTNRLGVGRSLWVFGLLQAFANGGYEPLQCNFIPGTSETFCLELLRQLNDLKNR